MIRNIILDWSGTLVDDLPAVWEATNYVMRQAGLPELSLDQFRSEFKLPFRHFYEQWAPNVPLPTMETWFHARCREVQHTMTALPHAREFLLFCRRNGRRTFLLSTVRRDYFYAQCVVSGFAEFFEETYLEVSDKRQKIEEILARHQLKKEETVFVGDMQHDIETARHGGVFSCAVLTGYNRLDQLRTSRPDVIVEHLGELQQILERNQFEWVPAASANPRDRLPVATVGALIFGPLGQVLLVRTRKWSNLWGIPGGKIKYGEPSEDALRREILEETGLRLASVTFVLVQDCIHSSEFYREEHFLLLNYLGQCAGETVVKLNEEAQESRWVSLDEALVLPLNQPTRTLIETVKQRTQSLDVCASRCG